MCDGVGVRGLRRVRGSLREVLRTETRTTKFGTGRKTDDLPLNVTLRKGGFEVDHVVDLDQGVVSSYTHPTTYRGVFTRQPLPGGQMVVLTF